MTAATASRRHHELTYQPGSGRFAQAGDARISADGRWVAFTGTRCDDLDRGTYTRIGLVERMVATDPDGRTSLGAPRILSSGPNDDHDPRWSPDRLRIAFLSDRLRAGQSQLVLLDVATGQERETAWVDGVVGSLEWASDGRSILLVVAGLAADQGDVPGPGRLPSPDAHGVVGWTPSLRETRDDDVARSLWIYDVGDDAVRRVSAPGLHVWEATWCGETAFAAVTSTAAGEGGWFDASLSLIALADGSDRTIHKGPFQLGRPAATPSGRSVAVVSGLASDRGIVPGIVILIELPSGVSRVLDSAGVDVTDLGWLDDDRLGFIGVRGLATVAGSVDRDASGHATETWVSRSSCGRHTPRASFARDGAMAVVNDDYATFQAVTVVGPGADAAQVSLAPAGIDALRANAGSVEAVAWQAPDGLTIDGWLCRPNGNGPFPLVLHVHGGPVGVSLDSWNMGNDTTRLLVEHGYAVLHPNPRGSYGRGPDFVARVLGDMGGADATDLLSGVDAMVGAGIADPGRLAVVGTSYGGFMANLLPTRDTRFRAAASMSPVTDWRSFHYTSNIPQFASLFLGRSFAEGITDTHQARSPLDAVDRCTTPTLEVAGARDLCTPAEQAVRFYEALASQGTPARLLIYPQAGHGVQHLPALVDLCAQVLSWLDDHLSTSPPSDG